MKALLLTLSLGACATTTDDDLESPPGSEADASAADLHPSRSPVAVTARTSLRATRPPLPPAARTES